MEAPVPASALIHSATLVSAGIYLILRFHPLMESSTYFKIIVPLVGSTTAFYGGMVAAFTSDIKRILAYSTISHCGFLMTLSAFYSNEITIFYLYVHGFFKATVFLNVGNVIRFSRNYQDFRRMGGFYKYLPFDCFLSFFCLFNLAGLPYSLGFFMKHLFFLVVDKGMYFYLIIFLNIFFGALFGLFYSYRLFYNVFFDFKKARKSIYLQTNKNNLQDNSFSNTTLASNVAVISLFVIAYLVIIYFYIVFTDVSNNYSDFDNFLINSSFYSKNFSNLNKAYNSSFIN
jgi:NADH:ubiquinone oxidoreductase subunit 5 (subunit L)/multisubunit Na+/H+ antiporter MnhA subunit